MKKLFIILTVTIVSCNNNTTDRIPVGIEYAKKELQNALSDTLSRQILADTLIADKETATAVAEKILFKIYGKDNITGQRPYAVNLIDGYWVLNGTLSKNMVGGNFLIIIKATNGQVIKLTHGK